MSRVHVQLHMETGGSRKVGQAGRRQGRRGYAPGLSARRCFLRSVALDLYDRTCHECFEPILSDFPMVVSPATGRRWHVVCAPPVEDDEQPRRKPRRMAMPGEPLDRRRKPAVTTRDREAWEARRDARLLVDRGVFLPG